MRMNRKDTKLLVESWRQYSKNPEIRDGVPFNRDDLASKKERTLSLFGRSIRPSNYDEIFNYYCHPEIFSSLWYDDEKEFIAHAEGSDDPAYLKTRKDYYPNWRPQDFVNLINDVNLYLHNLGESDVKKVYELRDGRVVLNKPE